MVNVEIIANFLGHGTSGMQSLIVWDMSPEG
jgi:hypothetical protein